MSQYYDLSSVGVKTLQKAGATEIAVDSLGNAEGIQEMFCTIIILLVNTIHGNIIHGNIIHGNIIHVHVHNHKLYYYCSVVVL